MGTLGYVMTFVILTILCLAMYATSKLVARIERRKAKAPTAPTAVPAAPAPTAPAAAPAPPALTLEEAVAVAAAIHAFISELPAPSPPAAALPAPPVNPWIIRARIDTRIRLGELIYDRIRRRRGWRGSP